MPYIEKITDNGDKKEVERYYTAATGKNVVKSSNYHAVNVEVLAADRETQQKLFTEIQNAIRKVRRAGNTKVIYIMEKK